MNTISLVRIWKSGFINFWRNIWLSVAATLVMTITLIILSVLVLLFIITNYSVSSIKERVDISAYFKTGVAESQILSIKREIEQDPKVKEVNYVSADEAFQEFKELHKEDQLIMDSLNELSENPLPATLQVKAITLEDYPIVAENLNNDKYKALIDKVNFEDNRAVIDRLNTILRFIITFGSILIIVFALIAILVIFNTITLTIYNRREEVEIMRLVGATNWYIRGPFMIEAALYSIAATIITSLLLIPVYSSLVPGINNYLNPGNNDFSTSFLSFPILILLMLAVSLFLSIFSTFLAIRKYLKI